MFRSASLNNNNDPLRESSFNLRYKCMENAVGFVTQTIFYDHPLEFEAYLNVMVFNSQFHSMSFHYFPKNNNGLMLDLSLATMNKDVAICYSDNEEKTLSYCLKNCGDIKLGANIQDIKNTYKAAFDYMGDNSDKINHCKEHLKNIADIVRAALRIDGPSLNIVHKINEVIELEKRKFETIIYIHDSHNNSYLPIHSP